MSEVNLTATFTEPSADLQLKATIVTVPAELVIYNEELRQYIENIKYEVSESVTQVTDKLTVDVTGRLGYRFTVKTASGTSYTPVMEDEGTLIRMINSQANTFVLPTDTAVPFDIGTILNIRQAGIGLTTVVPQEGVTVNTPDASLEVDSMNLGLGLVKVAPNEWDLVKSFVGVPLSEVESFAEDVEYAIAQLEEAVANNKAELEQTLADAKKSLNDAVAAGAAANSQALADTTAMLQQLISSSEATLTTLVESSEATLAQAVIDLNASATQNQDNLETLLSNTETRLQTLVNTSTTELNNSVNSALSQLNSAKADVDNALANHLASVNTKIADKLDVSDFGALKEQNGYQKLPGGLIMQWGRITISAHSAKQVSYPIPFPNAVFNVVGTMSKNGVVERYKTDVGMAVGYVTNSTFTAYNYISHGGGGSQVLYWQAIGH